CPNQVEVLFRGVAQHVWFGFVFCGGGDKREVHYPSSTQIQRVFITKLAIKVSNACDALGQVPLGLTARVDLLEHAAHQSAIAISGIGCDNLGSTKVKAYALVLPRLRPETG